MTVSSITAPLKTAAKWLYNVLKEDFWLILVYTLILDTCILCTTTPIGVMLRRNILQLLPACFLQAYCICLIGRAIRACCGRKVFIVWHIICHIILYFISFTGLFLAKEFGLLFNSATLQLFFQSNPNESKEFLTAYLTSPATMYALAIVLGVGIAEFLVLRYLRRFNPFNARWFRILMIPTMILCAINSGVSIYIASASNETIAYYRAQDTFFVLRNNYLVQFITAFKTIGDNSKIIEYVTENVNDTRLTGQSDYAGEIVVIIGESHNKKHSSLYGYAKETNPRLKALTGNLFVFNDVISYSNTTHLTLQNLMSVASANDSLPWYKATLFPAVFKAAGWNVALCSNQFKHEKSGDIFNAAIDVIFNNDEVSEACFTTRNNSIFKYDSQMIDSLAANRNTLIDSTKPTLTILQLMGQHVEYEKRYPAEKQHFKAADYADRKDLSDSQKDDVANYDNACLYNDEQLARIFASYADKDAIVIYFSDHGEEVHDYRKHLGRTHNLKEFAPNSYHYQFDIPFIVYVSDKYKANHPEIVEMIQRSVNRPFMTDDVCHLLFFLGGVQTGWYDATKCLISDKYKGAERHRVLDSGDDYDVISKIPE